MMPELVTDGELRTLSSFDADTPIVMHGIVERDGLLEIYRSILDKNLGVMPSTIL